MKYLIGFILGIFSTLLVMMITNRKNNDADLPSENIVKENTTNEISADFDSFYKKFHADSLFQTAHIVFPLVGLPNNVDSLTLAKGNYEWQAKDWRMHHSFEGMEDQFERSLSATGKDLITEYIIQKGTSFVMERRFSKIGNDWYLIYYAGMNDRGVSNN